MSGTSLGASLQALHDTRHGHIPETTPPLGDSRARPDPLQRMTPPEKPRTIPPASNEGRVMKMALFAPAGLIADGLRQVLAQLGADVIVERHDPDRDAVSCADCDLAVVNLAAVSPRKLAAAVTQTVERLPQTPVVAIAAPADEQAVAAVMQAGASGYVPLGFDATQALGVLRLVLEKAGVVPPEDIERAAQSNQTRTAGVPLGRNGRPYGLTQRELEVLALLVAGLRNKEIGTRLGIGEGVVKLHLHHCYEKLEVRTRTQAMLLAQQLDEVRQVQIENAGDIDSLRRWLLPHMSGESRRRGEVLFRKGDPGRALYFVQHGQVRLPELDKTIAEGELLGEIGIFAPDNKRTCSARCETDARLLSLSAERARSLFFANPQFAYYITRLISQRLLSR